MEGDGKLLGSPLDGGTPLLLAASGGAGAGYPLAMAASGGRVYYVDANGQLATAAGGIASSASVYFAHHVNAITTDRTNLYWASESTILRCALGPSCVTPSTIHDATSARSVAVDATNVYWIDDGSQNNGIPQVWMFHK
jgi:hypothetical protein